MPFKNKNYSTLDNLSKYGAENKLSEFVSGYFMTKKRRKVL